MLVGTQTCDLCILIQIQISQEFDLFDLQIHFYAKEGEVFQEINDPTFLHLFKDIQILHPQINFKEISDLDKRLPFEQRTI